MNQTHDPTPFPGAGASDRVKLLDPVARAPGSDPLVAVAADPEPPLVEFAQPPVVEFAEPPTLEFAEPRGSHIGRVLRDAWSVTTWLYGFAMVVVGLAVLAAVPLLQFLSLGYLLEAGGRVARSGRFRDGFIGVRLAGRIGGMLLWSWLLLLPARFVADLARSAQIIDPGSKAAGAWRVGLFVLIVATFIHIVAAVARGGRWYYFLWPINVVWLARRLLRGGYYTEARDAVWNTVASLRLPHYFWLGFRGFVGGLAWLALPISMLALSRGTSGAATLVGFLGAFLLAFVLMYLPFLQLRIAQTNRLAAVFQWRAVRAEFRQAPWAFALAFVVSLLFALPLYLLKIQIVPSEAVWSLNVFFIVPIFAARLLTGWAMGRAAKRETPRHWFWRWTGRLPFVPVALFYVTIVFFTQYTSWNGVFSLYEQHAFLVPVPFFSM